MRTSSCLLACILFGGMALATLDVCAQCSRYDLDWSSVPNAAKNAIGVSFIAWSGGTQNECEKMRQRAQAAMDQLRERVRDAKLKVDLALIDMIAAVLESDRNRTKAAFEQAKEAAEQANAAAPSFLASPGKCKCLFNDPPARQVKSGPNQTPQAGSTNLHTQMKDSQGQEDSRNNERERYEPHVERGVTNDQGQKGDGDRESDLDERAAAWQAAALRLQLALKIAEEKAAQERAEFEAEERRVRAAATEAANALVDPSSGRKANLPQQAKAEIIDPFEQGVPRAKAKAEILDPFSKVVDANATSAGKRTSPLPTPVVRSVRRRLEALNELRAQSNTTYDALQAEVERDFKRVANASKTADAAAEATLVLNDLRGMAKIGFDSIRLKGKALDEANREISKEALKLAYATPAEIAGTKAAEQRAEDPKAGDGLSTALVVTAIKSWSDLNSPSFWDTLATTWWNDSAAWWDISRLAKAVAAGTRGPEALLSAAKEKIEAQRQQTNHALDAKIAETNRALTQN